MKDTNLHIDTMLLFKLLPIDWLVPDISQVSKGSIKLVLLQR